VLGSLVPIPLSPLDSSTPPAVEVLNHMLKLSDVVDDIRSWARSR
jgi:hypothetical protein